MYDSLKSHNTQKKIAVINDISGFGKCSVAVSLPVISKMKVQCCPLPTAILSNHTEYEHFFFDDFTDKMPEYIRNWELLGLEFSGIYSGFLGSARQISIVEDFIRRFKRKETVVIIDPVMGDNGGPYPTFTEEMCLEMKRLVRYADILTPNLTEACILTDTPYKKSPTARELENMARRLTEQGPGKVVITGVPQGKYIANLVCVKDEECHFVKTVKAGESRCGTGDLFASILAADAVNGTDLRTSVKKASGFVKKCIIRANEMNIPREDGVPFEELLDKLK